MAADCIAVIRKQTLRRVCFEYFTFGLNLYDVLLLFKDWKSATTRQFINNAGIAIFPAHETFARGEKKKVDRRFCCTPPQPHKDLAQGCYFFYLYFSLVRYTLNIIYHYTPCSRGSAGVGSANDKWKTEQMRF